MIKIAPFCLALCGCAHSSVIIGNAEHARYTVMHHDGSHMAFYHTDKIRKDTDSITFLNLQGESLTIPCPCQDITK